MMYNNKLVVSLKANGKILREYKDTVYIPFGCEYSFLLKNLHTQRAVVNIFIDGDDAVEGGIVINSGQEVNLERYVKNGNLSVGNKFKFIERTNSIENGPRGIKLEDGLIRIEYQFELPRPVLFVNNSTLNTSYYPTGVRTPTIGEYPGVTDRYTVTSSGVVNQLNVGGILRGVDYSAGESTRITASAATSAALQSMGISNNSEIHDGSPTMDWNDVGITVPGSRSNQKFTTVVMGAMETEKHTIVFKLLGETPNNKPVIKPITVDRKPKCVTCGKQNKATAKFCTECGTALEVFS